MSAYGWLATVVAVAPYLAGCDQSKGGTASAPAQETGGQEQDHQTAALQSALGSVADSIAQARCDREERCGNIGTDGDYPTREACMADATTKWREELNAYDCPGGVEQDELQECLQAVRTEECERPFDTLGRIVSCRPASICKSE